MGDVDGVVALHFFGCCFIARGGVRVLLLLIVAFRVVTYIVIEITSSLGLIEYYGTII